jgi:predicted Zn-dependent protease
MKFRLISMICTVSLFITLTCAVNPVTGKRELMLLSRADEIALGAQTDAEIVQMYGIYDDTQLNTYVNTLGMRITPHTHQPDLPYSFKILDTDVVNAFAVPGGYVYLTRGILAYINSEAEIAGVIGHELGHVNARHTAKMMSQAQLAQLGLQLGSAISETFARFAGFAGFGVQLLFLRFSRDHEREADNLGVEYASKSGYDATGMASFFETLERMHPSDGGGIPDWFSTHPNPQGRIKAVRSKTAEWQSTLGFKTYKLDKANYIKQLDGLVFGPDPRQGYTANHVFYHPEMKFQFPIPSGWQVNNLPTQVQMISPDQKGIMLFTVLSASSLDEAITQFTSNTAATILQRDAGNTNGFQCILIHSEIQGEQPLRLLSNFILFDQSIFVFHGFSSPADFESFASPFFQPTLKGLKRLTDNNKIAVKPVRIHVQTIQKPVTLADLLTQQRITSEQQGTIAIMNGMQLNDRLSPGTQIKVIQE